MSKTVKGILVFVGATALALILAWAVIALQGR